MGCGTCVTVCMAGGEKEVGITSSAIRMARKMKNTPVEAILSLACGAGVQNVAWKYHPFKVFPALNTKGIGYSVKLGTWAENCRGCDNCILVGGGIAGMQASLDLADSGFKVYLLEKGTCLGGVMAQLDKTFRICYNPCEEKCRRQNVDESLL